MAATRSGKNTPQSSPPTKAQSARKRSADTSTSSGPPKKRGRPPKAATDSSPAPKKRGRPAKKQKTIEETLDVEIEDDSAIAKQLNGEAEHKSESRNGENDAKKTREEEVQAREDAVKKREDEIENKEQNGDKDETMVGEKNAFDEVKSDVGEAKEAAKEEQDEKSATINDNNTSIITDENRESEIPSSILEKGIIYFFFRGRVGVEDPQGIEDVARSYIVLRPLPLSAKLGDGPLEDSGNARLLALPKKMLPKSKQDRFLMFVEKGEATIKDLREQFAGNEYVTKTVGTSNTPAATPFAEGIYAITSTGRESHLAYHITVPSEIGEIQKELGLNTKGSYVLSVKNPNAPGPANATLDNPAQYPESIQKKFRGLRWMPLEPELLNYNNTQFLIIGECLGELGRSVEEMEKDKKDEEKEKPIEEMEKLEEEDHDRVEGLKEDDPIFADLGLSSKEYPHLQTTW